MMPIQSRPLRAKPTMATMSQRTRRTMTVFKGFLRSGVVVCGVRRWRSCATIGHAKGVACGQADAVEGSAPRSRTSAAASSRCRARPGCRSGPARAAAPAGARPGHRGGTGVVLDLEVQTTHQERHPPAATDVAGGADLAGEEVDLGVVRDGRHALVVRRERGAHHHAEHDSCTPRRNAHAIRTAGTRTPPSGRSRTAPRAACPRARGPSCRAGTGATDDGDHRVPVQVHALERQQREEQPALEAQEGCA